MAVLRMRARWAYVALAAFVACATAYSAIYRFSAGEGVVRASASSVLAVFFGLAALRAARAKLTVLPSELRVDEVSSLGRPATVPREDIVGFRDDRWGWTRVILRSGDEQRVGRYAARQPGSAAVVREACERVWGDAPPVRSR